MNAQRPAAYLVVAGLGMVVQLGTIAAAEASGFPAVLATAMGVVAAIAHNLVWHRGWTWRDRCRFQTRRRFGRYMLVTGIASLAGNVAFTPGYAAFLGVPLVGANLLAIWTTAAVNYLALDRWVFAEERKREIGSQLWSDSCGTARATAE